MVGVGLFLVGFVAAALLWLGGVVIPRRHRAIEGLRAFAVRRDAHVHGDGGADALRIVGYVGNRMFTVLYQQDWLRGSVLMIGVDCVTAAGGEHRSGDVVAEAGDAALASRWFDPSAEILEKIDTLVDALAEMAEGLERSRPGDAEVE